MSTTDAYFLVPSGPGLAQLFETDGTAASTRRIGIASFPVDPAMLTTAGSNLFFVDETTGDLWVTDGKFLGTEDLTSGSGVTADHLTAVGQMLFFVNDADHTLWQSDGTVAGTQQVAVVNTLSAEDLTAVGGTLFFVDAGTGDLWTLTSNGSAQDVGNFGTIGNLTAVGSEL